ncbi:hypothetical protein EJB05_34896, partial [Eragrostis curvula]
MLALLRHNPLAEQPRAPADDAVVVLPRLPHRVVLRRSQLLDPVKNRFQWSYDELVDDADARSYGEVFNSFADLEPGCVDHVWLVSPLAHARTDIADDDERCLR